ADRVKQNANQGGQPAILPRQIRTAIADLTLRPRKEQLRQVILAVCAFREWTTPAELAIWLDILPDNLTVRHLSPMTKSGLLERRYPDTPTHSDQAYRSPDRHWQSLLP
ncbi:MAG TPA: hypothetical protein DC058_04520, partial [Planctomycetaceae bacterium]|nr:hypothetical protein [Planctomycetaceae bacterium]